MTLDVKMITECVDVLIKAGYSLAVYRLVGEKDVKILMQRSRDIISFTDIGELDGVDAYVVAPFVVSKKYPIVVIQNDINTFEELVEFAKSIDTADVIKDEKRVIADFTKDIYSSLFQCFTSKINEHKFDKLVLARTERYSRREGCSVAQLFFDACELYPYSYVYLCHTPLSGTWLGCTPELLLSGDGEQYRTIALAATQTLQDGNLPFSWSEKDIREQEYVCSYIENQLTLLGIESQKSEKVAIRAGKLAHLRTDFSFSSSQKCSSIVNLLHPTPAVCGLPKDEAYKFILVNEPQENRAYYSGFVGECSNLRNQCRLYVNIRCMQILDSEFILYAGSGLIQGSLLEDEWQETKNKMQTMLQLI